MFEVSERSSRSGPPYSVCHLTTVRCMGGAEAAAEEAAAAGVHRARHGEGAGGTGAAAAVAASQPTS